MGWKTTVDMSRKDAEAKLLDLLEVTRGNVNVMTDESLSILLENLDDYIAGGESYNNYRIVEQHIEYPAQF